MFWVRSGCRGPNYTDPFGLSDCTKEDGWKNCDTSRPARDPAFAAQLEQARQAATADTERLVGIAAGGASLARGIVAGIKSAGLAMDGMSYELRHLAKHIANTAAAAKEGARSGSAHVFNDIATLSRVEGAIFARGSFTGTVRGAARYGMYFDEAVGYRVAADGSRVALRYGEMKVSTNGLYHIIPRTGPSR